MPGRVNEVRYCIPAERRRRFLRDDPEHVGLIVQRVDHLLDICVLETCDGVMRRHRDSANPLFRATGIAVIDSVHIVRTGERESVVLTAEDVEPLTGEQVHARVDSRLTKGCDPRPQTVEIPLVELSEGEFEARRRWPSPGPFCATDGGSTVNSGGAAAVLGEGVKL